MKIKVGDNVKVLAGKDRGKTGMVTKTLKKEDRVIVEGINVVNHCIFSFPELEQVVKFFQNQYPCQMKWAPEELCGEIRMIIQNIGNEEHTIHLKSNVLLKLLQETLCIKTSVESGLNSLEKAFLMEKDVI